MRIAVDTAILIRGHPRATGPARELVRIAPKLGVRFVFSSFILGEVDRVLRYPRIQALYRMSDAEIREYLNLLESIGDLVEVAEGAPVVLRDPNDDPIIYTALAGRADILCTVDNHFYDPNVLSFCSRHGIRLMSDLELLALLRSLRAE
jgi:putative PIN family toxin of toxin-antitoxin system